MTTAISLIVYFMIAIKKNSIHLVLLPLVVWATTVAGTMILSAPFFVAGNEKLGNTIAAWGAGAAALLYLLCYIGFFFATLLGWMTRS